MPAKKAAKSGAKVKKGGAKAKKGRVGLAIYIFRVIRQVSGNKLGVSSRGMGVLNSFVLDMLQRVGTEAGNLARAGGRKSINLPVLAAACRFAFPGELGRNAALEGAKAVAKFLEA